MLMCVCAYLGMCTGAPLEARGLGGGASRDCKPPGVGAGN